MKKILVNPPQLYGLSKAKIMWTIFIIGLLIVSFIMYGIFIEDEKNKENIALGSHTVYNPSNSSSSSVNQILQQVDDKLKRTASNITIPLPLVTSRLAVINNAEQESMIPPIIMNSNEIQAQKQLLQSKQQFKQKQIDNRYSSFGSKTLMFNYIPSRGNTSSPGIGNSYESQQLSFANEMNNNLNNIEISKSFYELKAGSIIPAIMINGINSDLPGPVIAQVRANIYDSITRRYLLVPQGAKLIGSYDSHVMYGQNRLAVAWQRLIYPDGSSVNLHALPGSDLAGYSGFYDQVDNKYWQIFGSSFIMGVITAGMQYSQNNTNSNVQSGGYTSPTMGQTLAGSLGQQLGQTSLAITQKNLNIQPTLIIRPNYPFNIILTADLVLHSLPHASLFFESK